MQNIDSQWGVPEAEMALSVGPSQASAAPEGAPTPDEYLLRDDIEVFELLEKLLVELHLHEPLTPRRASLAGCRR